MTRRDPALVVVLTLVTCGIYYFYWVYASTDDLKRGCGLNELSPGVDLLLAIVTCGIWGIYVQHRNVRLAYDALAQRGKPTEDRSTLVLVLNLCAFVTGITGLIAIFLVQQDLDKLAGVVGAPRA